MSELVKCSVNEKLPHFIVMEIIKREERLGVGQKREPLLSLSPLDKKRS